MKALFKSSLLLIALLLLLQSASAIFMYSGQTWQDEDVLVLPTEALKQKAVEVTEEVVVVVDEEGIEELEREIPGEAEAELIPVPAQQGKYAFPTEIGKVTFYEATNGFFATRTHGRHNGIDLGGPTGTPIYAADNGKITEARSEAGGGCGNIIVLKTTADDEVTWFKYCHLDGFSSKITKRGRGLSIPVKAGDLIGYLGKSGIKTSGPHLHFEAWKGGSWPNKASKATPVNPKELYPHVNWPVGKRGLVTTGAQPVVTTALFKFNDNKDTHDPLIAKCAVEYRISPNLIKAVMFEESGFNIRAQSSKEAKGLMQVKVGTGTAGEDVNRARRARGRNGPMDIITDKNVFDPNVNVCAGTEYLRILFDSYQKTRGNVAMTIAGYNAGPNNPSASMAYYRRVNEKFKKFTGRDISNSDFNYVSTQQPVTTAQQAAGGVTRKIVLFGDSLSTSNNYLNKVKSSCPSFSVVAKAVPGRRTDAMASSFHSEVGVENPSYVVVLGGANDFGISSVTPENILSELNQIYDHAKTMNIKVVAVSVTPFGSYAKSPWNTKMQIDKVPVLNNLIKPKVGANVFAFVDAYSVFDDGSGKLRSEYNGDGLHLNSNGYNKLGERVASAIPECRLVITT